MWVNKIVLYVLLLGISCVMWYVREVPKPIICTGRCSVHVATEPEEGLTLFDALVTAATSSIDLVMYELEDSSVEQQLVGAHDRGVTVRVILNGGYWGKKENTKNDDASLFLTAHGVSVHWSPHYFALTHEKSLLVDHARLLILTGNLTPQYYASSRDFMALDTDPSDIRDASETFEADWNNSSSPSHAEDNLVWSPESKERLIQLIDQATSSLSLYNEEMVDTDIVNAISSVARRGVSVRIIMTDNPKWHSAWNTLTNAGASVHYFSPKSPLYIHAKMLLVDGSLMFLGSENFSKASLEQNRELGIIIQDHDAISSVEHAFEKDWGDSTLWR